MSGVTVAAETGNERSMRDRADAVQDATEHLETALTADHIDRERVAGLTAVVNARVALLNARSLRRGGRL